MKEKLLLLLKVSGCSLLLFSIWHPISKVYGFILSQGLSLSTRLVCPYGMKDFQYEQSLIIIPFISLIIATPKIKVVKKTGIILAGVILFLLLDILAFQLQIEDINMNPTGFIVYRGIKLFFPFLLWIIVSYSYIEELFKLKMTQSPVIYYSCPICGKEDADVMDHIREVHGERSFKIKKVKMFITENLLREQ